MPKASVKRLIDNRKDKLIEFVLDIEKYPEFIPFCDNSKVYERIDKDDTINIIADLRSSITCNTSSLFSPKPTIKPDFVKIFLLIFFAFFKSSTEAKYLDPGLTFL